MLIRRLQLTGYFGDKIGTKNIFLKANDKVYFADTEFVFTRQTFLHWKMTENEHDCKGLTPMNVTYARFEIQLIDLPRSQASQTQLLSDPEYRAMGHVSAQRTLERSGSVFALVALDYRDESVSYLETNCSIPTDY